MNRKALIFGHSHVWSLKKAIMSGVYAPAAEGYSAEVVLCGTREFPGPLISTGLNGSKAINACLIASLSGYQPGEANWLVSAIQGNFYNILAMIAPDPLFDTTVPWQPDLPVEPSAVFLPYDAVFQMMKEHTEELELLLKQLPGLGFPNIIHINAPPPVESEEFILADLREKNAIASDTGQRVTPATIRLKLWLLQCDLIARLCHKIGVHCVHAPADTRDENGFLKREYWKDSVHANEAYSMRILQEVEKVILSGGAT